ncbi:MAG: YigZ family protein [Deltaproteobacteria bacterium]|nr:YigZ family protein [Deltaproteobacteria bacterium]
MSQRYSIPDLAPGQTHNARIVVRRSRFLAAVAHCASVESARSFIQAQRQKYADATHNCWAFCAGPPGDTAQVAYNDGGEPHGTAGRPMLTALLHSGVGELACVTTRYFGGVKLGTAGLVRAYQDSVRAALADLPLRTRVESAAIRVTVNYQNIDALRRILSVHEAHVSRESFAEAACFDITISQEYLEAFRLALNEQSAGSARIELVAAPKV